MGEPYKTNFQSMFEEGNYFFSNYTTASVNSFVRDGINFFVNDFYGYEFVNGKEDEKQDLKIKPFGICRIIDTMVDGFVNGNNQFDGHDLIAHTQFFSTELAFSYAVFKIYTNLILNGFLDEIKYKHSLYNLPNDHIKILRKVYK